MKTIHIQATKSYDVKIERDLLDWTGVTAAALTGGAAFVVSDDTVFELYGERVIEKIRACGLKVGLFVFPHGETSKNAQTYIDLVNALADFGITRSDVLIALGGGVTGDLCGFAASTYLRGVRWIQVPTTILAAVDSSVGGKTAIDLPAGKNLVGTFYQPDAVLVDPDVFRTLPESVVSDGFAEIIKYGVIWDVDLFESLVPPVKDMEAIIARCIEIKRDVVQADEFDTGQRQILNYGHTFGHALEKLSNFKLTHGSAVAIGMVIAMRGAIAIGQASADNLPKLIQMLEAYGLPVDTQEDEEAVFQAMMSDKKKRGGEITLVVPTTIGKVRLMPMGLDQVRTFLHLGLGR